MADAAASLKGLARQAEEAVTGMVHAAEGVEKLAVDAVNSQDNRPLYESRKRIHPKKASGIFRKLKWIVMFVTMAVYYLTPWIRWDRGMSAPDQAVLLDFPNRKFYFFFIEIWPQQIYLLTGLLILAALALFLVTSLAGRVWCGYTCPQTVWTDMFIAVERWVEGDRNARLRLDKQPWSAEKIRKRFTKHIIWILIALSTGGAWVFYFRDAPTLAVELVTLKAPLIAYLFIAIFAAVTYVLGGLMREQVCTYMCPWPRIQGAMFDEDSLLVTYRTYRGEPRGAHKKGEEWEGRGDCIDCKLCVAVCPMGIDIRDGPQLECIQCALCIDACDSIMTKIGRPAGLIAYDTFRNIEGVEEGRKPVAPKLIRPRTIVYSVLIGAVGVLMLFALISKETLTMNVLRDRNPLFVPLSSGDVRNGYTLKIINQEHRERRFVVSATGAGEASVKLTGYEGAEFVVPGDEIVSVRLFVTATPPTGGNVPLTILISEENGGQVVGEVTSFRGPGD